MEQKDRLITVAIHTYAKALILKTLLENEGIPVVINNVNLIQPIVSSGVRVRIHESDLPLALKIIEQMTQRDVDVMEDKNKPHVLIPVDFSEYSKKACQIGFDFAKQINGRVILLHSYIAMPYAVAMMPFTEEDYDFKKKMETAHQKMNDFERMIKNEIAKGTLPGVKFSCKVEEGVPEVSIVECAERENVALIVMGTRGKNKKEAELIGSVTAEVLDAAKFPVFSVPEHMDSYKTDDIKNVVFFSNLIQQDLLSFDIFARLFAGKKLKVTIIPVEEQKKDEKSRKYLDYLVQYCENNYKDFDFKIEHISNKNYIDDFGTYVKEDNIDLILIPNKKRNIFARLFSPSVAHKMVFYSDIPLFVVPI